MQFEPISGSWDEPYWERPESSFLNLEVFISYLFNFETHSTPMTDNGLVIKNPSPFAAVSVAPLTLQRKRPPRYPEPPPAQNRSQGLY